MVAREPGRAALTVAAESVPQAQLRESGYVEFADSPGWAPTAPTVATAGSVDLHCIRARSATADFFGPPVRLRAITSDVLNLQLYRDLDREMVLTVIP